MRLFKNILIISILLLPNSFCKKTNVTTNVAPKEVIGKWKWIYTYLHATNPPINPITPLNTGINEIITYYADRTWSKIQNNNLIDSGSYSIGHGNSNTYPGTVTIYDSIQYYLNNVVIAGKVDYYFVAGDSLNFNPGYSGVYSGDSKWLIKQ